MTKTTYADLLQISVPVTLVQFTASLLLVTDTFMIKTFAPEALATLGGGNGIFLFAQFSVVAAMFSIDGYIAFAVVRDDPETHREILGTSMFLAIILGLLCVFAAAILFLGWQGGDKRQIAIYILMMSLSLPFFLVFLVFQKFWISRGESIQMFQINLFGLALNALADVVLLHLLLTEPDSALSIALATVVLRMSALTAVLWYTLARLGKADTFRIFLPTPHGRTLRKLSSLSLSTGLNGVLDSATMLLLSLGAIHYGTYAMEISQYAITLSLVLFPLYIGIGNAATILVGGALGQGQLSVARIIAWRALKLASLFAAVATALILGTVLTRYARIETELALVLLCVAAYQWADAIQAVGAGILRASNFGTPQVLANALAFYGVGPLILVICLLLNFEFLGLWVTFSLAIITTGFFHYLLYLKWSWHWIESDAGSQHS
ncbi:MATE family efflux transporter [Billgrantia endophytica]|uniref:MATE family efflux transporter n=1 Tax=Billgrantia endophytica TaxID=2033802 RepID=A0A2N7UE66_9GAMM|nr:MATE family efflux transporter [Halomonas endophytica]PMR78723.1 hypothetical protein C1H69_00140 [Halomonas endophytica]